MKAIKNQEAITQLKEESTSEKALAKTLKKQRIAVAYFKAAYIVRNFLLGNKSNFLEFSVSPQISDWLDNFETVDYMYPPFIETSKDEFIRTTLGFLAVAKRLAIGKSKKSWKAFAKIFYEQSNQDPDLLLSDIALDFLGDAFILEGVKNRRSQKDMLLEIKRLCRDLSDPKIWEMISRLAELILKGKPLVARHISFLFEVKL